MKRLPSKPRLSDLASATGLAVSTVSRALSGDPLMADETIRLVRKVAEELGYRRPVEKRLDTEREELASRKQKPPSLCLLLPYPFLEYSYTKLDLMMIDAAEHCMHAVNGMLYTTRLSEDGHLPGWLVERGVDAVVMKSYHMPPAQKCPMLYNVPVVSVFGFKPPGASTSWVTSDVHRGIQDVWEGVMAPRKCAEVVLVGSVCENIEFQEKQTFLQSFCARGNHAYRECRLNPASRDESLATLVKTLRDAKGKPLVYVARTSEMDMDCALALTRQGIRPGLDAEIVVEAYDCDPARNPEYHWLDLRGRELVHSAVHYALHPGSRTQSRIQLPPRLIRGGSAGRASTPQLVENSPFHFSNSQSPTEDTSV